MNSATSMRRIPIGGGQPIAHGPAVAWSGGDDRAAPRRRAIVWCWVAACLLSAAFIGSELARRGAVDPWDHVVAPPATLQETGLYADWSTKTIAEGVLAFEPQYPLWSDGAAKRRWIYLPSAIDATDPDRWQFPVGTRLWKEFSFGRRVETRFMVRTDTGWHYATYAWSADGARADKAPLDGLATTVAVGDGAVHRIPSEPDCRACHGNGASPVLGFSALQLSADRDPGALHRSRDGEPGIDLGWLADHDLVRGIRDRAPRIAGNPTQRAALGYLHGNCGGCHRAEGPLAGLGMVLAHSVTATDEPAARTTIGQPSQYRAPSVRVVAGDADHSLLIARMRARHSPAQMPPLGTELIDAEAIRLVADWIDQLAPNPQENRK